MLKVKTLQICCKIGCAVREWETAEGWLWGVCPKQMEQWHNQDGATAGRAAPGRARSFGTQSRLWSLPKFSECTIIVALKGGNGICENMSNFLRITQLGKGCLSLSCPENLVRGKNLCAGGLRGKQRSSRCRSEEQERVRAGKSENPWEGCYWICRLKAKSYEDSVKPQNTSQHCLPEDVRRSARPAGLPFPGSWRLPVGGVTPLSSELHSPAVLELLLRVCGVRRIPGQKMKMFSTMPGQIHIFICIYSDKVQLMYIHVYIHITYKHSYIYLCMYLCIYEWSRASEIRQCLFMKDPAFELRLGCPSPWVWDSPAALNLFLGSLSPLAPPFKPLFSPTLLCSWVRMMGGCEWGWLMTLTHLALA